MINFDNLAFVEEMYARPEAWDPQWKDFFENGGKGAAPEPGFRPASIFHAPALSDGASPGLADAYKQERVDQLIRAYRVRGHRIADLDPLGRPAPPFPELQMSHYGLTDADLELRFSARSLSVAEPQKLGRILEILRSTYCRSIGVQYMHIDDPVPKFWLEQRMESTQNQRKLSPQEQIRILTRLTDAEIFEEFIHKKFVGAKRFGLEGGESLIPLLDLALEDAGAFGVEDVVIGMAHRGRLNVMANIMLKDPMLIFREFQDADPELHFGRGDVKYHLGYHSTWSTSTDKKIQLTLCFNPSHLEFVGPVALGRVRARQDRLGPPPSAGGGGTSAPTADGHSKVMALVIHGDAAMAGQGVIQEMLNLSEVRGYSTGGTIHVVVNNQIGFTALPRDARSSHYPTDVAKMLQIPIFHVNGEHPEAVAQAIHLAMEYRDRFKKDVVIDMFCYRRLGHNEGDDPTYTQPHLYQLISERPSVREGYIKSLGISRAEADEIAVRRREYLEEQLAESRSPHFDYKAHSTGGIWAGYRGGPDREVPEVSTAVEQAKLVGYLQHLCKLPEGFTPHPKVEKLLFEARHEMAEGKRGLDWGTAENLAYASLVDTGVPVRVSGQDCERGTFSHRHAVLYDYQTGQPYTALKELGPFQVWNSPLTETAVVAYEYGLSMDRPEALVIWEAQFGDFANVAQVIIDQFIVSSEDKWNKLNALVMLLPHGFEGQGPEHSSARLERYLSLAAEDNIQVVNLTTPAQLFHCLRRQVVRPWRKPLIVMSPKSLLRHPECVSSLDDLSKGSFHRVLGDGPREKVSGVLLCSGKLYYELDAFRQKHERHDVAIVRLEQLYPFPEKQLKQALSSYAKGTHVIWVQEEPSNMGALPYLRLRLGELLFDRYPFLYLSRPESASPATGSGASHKMEQASLIGEAFQMSKGGK